MNDLPPRRVMRAIKDVAKFGLLAHAQRLESGSRTQHAPDFRGVVYIAIHTLGYKNVNIAAFLAPAGDVAFAAQLYVDYGPIARYAYRYWVLHQGLLAVLNYKTTPARSSCLELINEMRDRLQAIATDQGPSEVLADVHRQASKGGRLSKADAKQMRDILVDRLEPLVDAATGCDDDFFASGQADAGLSYEEVYKLCRVAGRVLACGPFLSSGVVEDDDLLHRRFELKFALDRLRFPHFVLPTLNSVHATLSNLSKPSRRLKSADFAELEIWLDSFLSVYYGARTTKVLRLSRGLAYFRRALSFSGPIAGLCVDSLRSIVDDIASIDEAMARSSASTVARLQDGRPVSARQRRLLSHFVTAAEKKLDDLLPAQPEDRIKSATIAVASNKLRGYRIPVDEDRIYAFIQQFPQDQRWIATSLVTRIEHYDERFFSCALSAVMGRPELTEQKAFLTLFGNSRKSSGFMAYILDRKVQLRHRELRDVLSVADDRAPIIFVDDCCITGTQTLHILKELYFPSESGYKYVAPLRQPDLDRLRRRPFLLVYALASNGGLWRVNHFLKKRELPGSVIACRELPLLNSSGMVALEEGKLLGSENEIVAPEEHLADPLFSPSSRMWHEHSASSALKVCEDIGYQLLERRALSENWTEGRRRMSALGYSRLQSMITFDHNVPKSTLTLLWETGTVNGRPWLPLLPSRE